MTQNFDSSAEILKDIDLQNIYRDQWKTIQSLSERFWSRLKREYLQTLQKRVKWTETQPDLHSGDVILLKDVELCRNSWPVGIVVNAIKGHHDHVRRAEVRVITDNKPIVYKRPITQ